MPRTTLNDEMRRIAEYFTASAGAKLDLEVGIPATNLHRILPRVAHAGEQPADTIAKHAKVHGLDVRFAGKSRELREDSYFFRRAATQNGATQ